MILRALLSGVSTALVAVSAAAGPADPWTIDPAASKVTFTARQMNAPIVGAFGGIAGTIVLDPADLAAARIDVTVDTATARSGQKDVDDQAVGPDFLAARQHPRARFASERIVHEGGDRYRAEGKLTLRDTTRDAALPFTLRIADDPAAPGRLRAAASGRLELKRLDYGVGRGDWKATDVVADEVAVSIEIAATRAK